MHLEGIGPVLERVILPDRLEGKFPGFSHGNESSLQTVGYRGRKDEAASFDPGDLGNAVVRIGLGHGINELGEGVTVSQHGCDVLEDDPWLREVGDVSNEGGEVFAKGFIQNKDQLPRIKKKKKGDQIYSFNTDDINSPDIRKFYEEQGKDGIQWTSHGVMWDILYEISVPQHIQLNIHSKFGLIDIENFNGSIQANSKHGGVDLAVNASRKMDFNIKSDWGEIFTDLDLNFDKTKLRKWTEFTCNLNGGGGAMASLESKHGNIYLRESK